MKDFHTSRYTLDEAFEKIADELLESPLLLLTTVSPSKNKWSMARLFRMWMVPTAKFMSAQGVTMPLYFKSDGTAMGKRVFNGNDAYELFTRRWGGLDKNNNRLSWTKQGHDDMSPADNGQRFDMLRRHEEWATDKGIMLFKPREGSEFYQLQQKQDE